MFKIFSIFVVGLVLAAVCDAEKTTYNGYRLVRFSLNADQVHLLHSWEGQEDFDLWAHSKESEKLVATVLLSPLAFLKYRQLFAVNNITFEVLENNIQRKIEEQEEANRLLSKADQSVIGKYARYNDIMQYLQDMAKENPAIASTYVTGSKTHEGRDLRVLVIKGASASKAIWLDCGIHAREWVSPATCMYFINKLITGYKSGDATVLKLLNTYEFHILPVVNPDGYEYSHTTTRLWRKNRRPNSPSSCVGTDLNRNYPYAWFTGGSSSNPCDDTFAGPSAGSEIETKAVMEAINKKLGSWTFFLTLHSYGHYWMIPFGNTNTRPTDYNELKALGQIGQNALQGHAGTKYSFGTPPELLYIASGGSFDWSKATAGIKYSYCLELSPGQTGVDATYGFTLPPDRIPKVGEEAWKGLTAMILAV